MDKKRQVNQKPHSRIELGIFPGGITLTPVMHIRSIIALLMGLVIQLSQVHASCMASDSAKSCGMGGQAMSCCDGLQSCPCVGEGDSKQAPAPLVPAAVDLKPLISPAPERISPAEFFPPSTDAAVPAASWPELQGGFSGVPLSVVFCRFVI